MVAPDNPYPKPSAGDWAVTAAAVTLTVCGVIALPYHLNAGIVTIAFFGPIAALVICSDIKKGTMVQAARSLPHSLRAMRATNLASLA